MLKNINFLILGNFGYIFEHRLNNLFNFLLMNSISLLLTFKTKLIFSNIVKSQKYKRK